MLGGLVAGFAAYPRKEGTTIAWTWLLLMAPLWLLLFALFGLAPILTRTSDFVPLVSNCAGFIGSALTAYLIALKTLPKPGTTKAS